jgi:hypothetical protein
MDCILSYKIRPFRSQIVAGSAVLQIQVFHIPVQGVDQGGMGGFQGMVVQYFPFVFRPDIYEAFPLCAAIVIELLPIFLMEEGSTFNQRRYKTDAPGVVQAQNIPGRIGCPEFCHVNRVDKFVYFPLDLFFMPFRKIKRFNQSVDISAGAF